MVLREQGWYPMWRLTGLEQFVALGPPLFLDAALHVVLHIVCQVREGHLDHPGHPRELEG